MRRWWWVMNTPHSEEIALMKRVQQERCRGRARKRGVGRRDCRRRVKREQDLQQDADWQQVLAALPADVADVAGVHGAFCRWRQVRAATDLLRLVFVYALGDFSLRLVAAWAGADR